jgi:hypothetical protein
MKMKVLACSVICMFFVATNAFGAVEKLFGGVVNEIEDQDYETLASGNGDFVVEVGELVGGVIKFQLVRNTVTSATNDLQTSPDTFTAIFLIEVATSTGEGGLDGDTDTLTFIPAGQAAWDSVFGTGGSIDLGLGASPITIATGTMINVYEGISFSSADESTGGGVGASAATFVSGGTSLWEFGFTGAGGTAATGEFWSTRGEDADVASAVLTTDPVNRFSLNLTNNPSGIPLDVHNFLGTSGDAFFTTAVQLQGKGGFQSAAGTDWPLSTDTNVYIVPVPEPASLIAWTMLLSIGSVVCLFRRRTRGALATR